jgi:hypothetical protein
MTHPAERMLGIALPLFEHIEQHRKAAGPRLGRRGRALLHDRVRSILTRWLGEQMSADAAHRSGASVRLPPELLAQNLAATFVLVLEWCIDHGCTAAEADRLFRSLVLPAMGPAPAGEAADTSMTPSRRGGSSGAPQ